MPVLINEFEVLGDAPPAPGRPAAEPEAPPAPADVDPHAHARSLRALERQALRVWAH